MSALGRHAPRVTGRAPHLRAAGDVTRQHRDVVIALLPCLLLGLHNAGLQANLALAELGRERAPGWRGDLLAALGLGQDPDAVVACALQGLLWFLPLLAVALLTALGAQRLFEWARRRPTGPGLGLVALLFTLCVPPTLPLWQAALGVAFGAVLGREIFGGLGRNFLHPALVGLAFLYFAYPAEMRGPHVWTPVDGTTGATALALVASGGLEAVRAEGLEWWASFVGRVPGGFGETSTLGCLLGAAYLVARRAASWRIMAGAALGLVGASLAAGWAWGATLPAARLPWFWHLTLGGFAFGAVFLATDPVSAAATDRGRWIYGLAIGALVVAVRAANPAQVEGVALAILLGNVFAPLIDHAVVWAHVRSRERRRA